jgi:hypothetical protein
LWSRRSWVRIPSLTFRRALVIEGFSRSRASERIPPWHVREESTTPDLEELARRLSEAMSRRDLDSMMRLYSPDAVFDVSSAGLGTFEGRAAIRHHLEDWWAAYEKYEFELVETMISVTA